MTIYVYQEAANVGPSYTKYPRDGQTLLYTHTGTGGLEKMPSDWRTANPTATAASIALPPLFKIFIPTKEASRLVETTIPFLP